MNVTVDVQPIIFAGQHDGTVVHEGDVEALGVFDFGLESGHQLSFLGEYGQIEIVVIVGDEYLARGVNAHSDRIVGDALAADLPQVLALVVEHLDAVRPVVGYEDLLFVVDHHTVGEFQVLGTAELDQHVAGLVEYDDAHHLALDHHDAALVVDGDAARVLQYVGAELAHELPVLVVDLDLVRGRPFGDDYVAGRLHHGHAVRVQQLTVPFAALAELELEPALLVEYLDAVVVGVGHDYVVLRIHRHAAGLGELTLHGAELAKLAVVDHLVALDLRLGREYGRGEQLAGQVQYRVVVVDRQREVRGTGAVLEYVAVAAVGPLLVRVDAVHATTAAPAAATTAAVHAVQVAHGVQVVQVADGAGRERAQAVDAVEALRQNVLRVVLAGQRAGRREPVRVRALDDATAAHAVAVAVHHGAVVLQQVRGTGAAAAVHAAHAVGDDCRRVAVHQRPVGGPRDRRLLAGPDDAQLRAGPHVPERVAHAHLDRLVVGHELQVADVLHAVVRLVAHQRLQLRVQQLLEQQALHHVGVLGQTVHEFARLVDLVHHLEPLLRRLVERQLLGAVHALHLLEQLLLALLQHRPVERERLVDLVLRLVVLHLQLVGRVLDVLHHVADVRRLGLALLHRAVQHLEQLDADLVQVLHVVHAELVVAERALLAHGHVARAAKVLERLVLVPRAEHHAVAHAGRYELARVVGILERQPVQAVVLKAVHVLVGHHAVGAQRLLTVVAVGHHVRVEILAALAHAGELVRVHLDGPVHREVGQQAGHAAVREYALLVAVGARDLFRLVLVVL